MMQKKKKKHSAKPKSLEKQNQQGLCWSDGPGDELWGVESDMTTGHDQGKNPQVLTVPFV